MVSAVAVDTVYVDVNVNGQASRNIKDYASFDTAKTAVREYARASCKNFSINTKDQADSTVLSVTIDKSVYPAYTSCLELYKDGVRVSQTPGYNGRSLTVDFKYVPPSGSINAEVNFTGINIKPAGAATCSMFGYGKSNLSPNGIAGLQSFVFRMEPNAVYSVYCALTATAPLNNFTTVFLYTSKGSSFQALLYNGQGHDEIKRIARLETRMTELKAKLNIAPDGRTLQPKRVCAGNACVAGRGNSIVFQHKATGFVRAEFDFTKITSVANLDRFKIYTGPTLAANTDSYFFVSKENRMGVWSMSKSRPDMKLVATKYCTDHYDWDCITSFTPVCRNVTTPAKAGAGSTDPRVALPGHRVWCGTDEFLQGWTPKRSYDNVWFEFTCCKLPR
ncbi:hypothetical protein HYH03_012369 [Edaphochlamys debaryana]|uniref:Uncharacterized protein n=1 Tax=Edaphochlamys debaryana TaxID=47281 RepID=A0A835XU99_9CHLO|nr:hypothetical protein HYH03_012369 [Edaphochlamys debaryana]|eukprot:KAG2489143.1 hypothetical protein HYH03_012369 [Edaphochlamys debaryana]